MNPPPTDQPPLQAMSTDAYLEAMSVAPSPSIANATPSYGSAPVHPPYAEMIMAAITALKEMEGSSKQAIAKYIERAYPNLPAAHPALLTHHLKRLKNSGQLVLLKKSYMLPPPPGSGSDLAPPPIAAAPPADFSPLTAEKRRPGRPPKPRTPSFEAPSGEISDPSAGLSNAGVVSAKRRGRPPKPKPAPPGFEYQNHLQQQPVYAAEPLASNNSAAVVDAGLVNGSASLPKRRGRPPKYLTTSSVGDQAPATTYTVGSADVGGAALVNKRPGRPPKAGNRPRGRPRKGDGLAAPPVRQVPPASSGRPRGRPRKRPMLALDGGNVAAVGIKRRGRPRGVTGPRKLMIMRTGRPRGRPRKNASTVGTHASRQSEFTASVELTRKLEYMQLKVKNAVGLLKPHLINANIIDILTAIQDLEELATMDIIAQTTTATETAPMAEPIAPVMVAQEMAPPPTDIAAPQLDLSAPAYPDPGAVGQLPTMTFN